MKTETVLKSGIALISPTEFVHGMRHGGYRSVASAISELVDNAVEAKASQVSVTVDASSNEGPRVEVLDNGAGMTPTVLRRSLQFGGTSRFDSRSGMGRFGLGLPAGSLSFSRRVSVYTWRWRYRVYRCHLDVDEVSRGMVNIEEPEVGKYPGQRAPSETGTLVVWEKCDRLGIRRLGTLTGNIRRELGRRFRRFLWEGIKISVNGEPVVAIDPLMRTPDESGTEAVAYGPAIKLSVRTRAEDGSIGTGAVEVRFSELPIKEWFSLSPAEKRRRGISGGAGVSVLRAGREVDYGWFFMGGKRRENYDDWWRCEIEFSPVLDEEFGISHTKQQIRPSEWLKEILTPVVEPVARTLTMRVRKTHELVAAKIGNRDRLAVAQQVEEVLPTLTIEGASPNGNIVYSVDSAVWPSPELYAPVLADGKLTLLFNAAHEFYRRIGQLGERAEPFGGELKSYVEVLLLAAARAEIAASQEDAQVIQRFRAAWGKTISAYLAG